VALLAGLVTLLSARPAAAHGLGAEAKLKGNTAEVAAFFDDDTPAIGARVTVKDEAGKTVAEGKTDEKGRWAFPRPTAGKYRLTVDAGAGHRARVALTVPAAGVADSGAAPSGPADDGPCDCCAADDGPVSDGPTREEFTRTRWGRIGLGLALIAAFAGAWVLGRRRMPA
jgi:nickel transport protein